jgi:hypothetical protein
VHWRLSVVHLEAIIGVLVGVVVLLIFWAQSRSVPDVAESTSTARKAPGYDSGRSIQLNRRHWREIVADWQSQAGSQTRSVLFWSELDALGLTTRLRTLGFDPAGLYAIMAWETATNDGFGRSFAAMHYDNLSGISYHDAEQGRMRPYLYDSVDHWYAHMLDVLRTLHPVAFGHRRNASRFITELWHSGYNSSAEWHNGCQSMLHELKQG